MLKPATTWPLGCPASFPSTQPLVGDCRDAASPVFLPSSPQRLLAVIALKNSVQIQPPLQASVLDPGFTVLNLSAVGVDLLGLSAL